MFIIEVIPYATLPPNVPQLLSYFNDTPLQKGALVEIVIGRRKEKAVVVSCSPLERQKGSLKKSAYQLKKLSKVLNPEPQLNDIQFKILLWLAKYYYAPLGISLKTVLPSFVLNKSLQTEVKLQDFQRFNLNKQTVKPEILVSSARNFEKKLLEAVKTVKGQTLIIAPDLQILNHFHELLSESEPIIIYSAQGVKEKFKNWQKVRDGAKVILGTRLALFYPFKNLEQIIIEDSSSEMYKSDMTPKYNASDLAERIASLYNSKLIIHASFASIEQYYNFQSDKYSLAYLKNSKIADTKIIDTVNELRASNFSVLSRELKNEILSAVRKNQKILLFSPRKGYSGNLLCQNCGVSVKCPNCAIPLRVHKTVEFVLVCYRCSYTQKFPPFCQNCNSYKLKTAGPSGSQKIYDETRELLLSAGHKAPILILDSEVVKNDAEEEEIISELKKPESVMIIGGQMIFSHRYDFKFPIIGVINADSMSVFPDYSIEEKFLCQIKKLLDFEPDKIIVQTYSSENKIYEDLEKTDYEEFYRRELELRKIFNYPPFCRLAKLSYRHTDQKRAFTSARILSEKLKMASAHEKLNDKITILDASPAFIAKEKGFYIYNIILKLSLAFENPKDILKYVPSDWTIDLDPRSIL